jgi:hypothetical protein
MLHAFNTTTTPKPTLKYTITFDNVPDPIIVHLFVYYLLRVTAKEESDFQHKKREKSKKLASLVQYNYDETAATHQWQLTGKIPKGQSG